jgi:hypothetical protein
VLDIGATNVEILRDGFEWSRAKSGRYDDLEAVGLEE